MGPNFALYLKLKTSQFSDHPFLCDFGSQSYKTYGEVDEITDRLAGGLRALGITAGDRVALLHPNHTDFILAYMAIIKAGAVAVPINPQYTPTEVCQIVENAGAGWLISTDAFEAILKSVCSNTCCQKAVVKRRRESLLEALERECGKLRPFVAEDIRSRDPAFIFYTSGTTGRPKGVILTHGNIMFGGANTAQNYGLRETDIALACLPLVHIFANASPVLGTLNSGGAVIVMERFRTDPVLRALEEYCVTWFPGVPTMFGYLLNACESRPRVFPALRMGLSGGASLSAEHLKRFESVFQAPVLEVYGLTESTGLVTANPVYGRRKAGSVGITVSGVSVRLVAGGRQVSRGEVGEIVFQGPNATPGYWRDELTTATIIRDGWVHTGDLARKDEDGFYFLVGRKDELIISGGYNVYPREIEEVLYMHEDITEAAVVGIAHQDLGEAPKAFIALKPGSRMTPKAVQAFCKNHLAAYKLPKEVEFLRELPKNSTGKIIKKWLPKR